jgi:hypothetical protein
MAFFCCPGAVTICNAGSIGTCPPTASPDGMTEK